MRQAEAAEPKSSGANNTTSCNVDNSQQKDDDASSILKLDLVDKLQGKSRSELQSILQNELEKLLQIGQVEGIVEVECGAIS